MSLVESLQVWKEGVQCYNEGDFRNALKKFKEMNDSSAKIMFNIGRVHISLCDLQNALQAFKLVIKKDEHLAVGHFMLGVVNLMCSRHSDALINFNETFRNLRGSKFIDYKQLGMRYRLYKCEVLLNRAVCLSSLGYFDSAIEDLLAALQCKAEPRHNIIDISLNNLQKGHSVEFLVMDAIFQPPKSKIANLEKRDYLGKAQVVVDTDAYETMETPLHLRNQPKASFAESSDSGEAYRVLYDFTAQSAAEVSVKAGDVITIIEKGNDGWFTMTTNNVRKTGLVPGSYLEKIKDDEQGITNRQALLKDLRKKETRQSLRRVQTPPTKQQPKVPSGGKFDKFDSNNTRKTEVSYEPRKNSNAGNENSSPKLPSKNSVSISEPRIHSGPPKFRRKNSFDNLLGRSPSNSPTFKKNLPEVPMPKPKSSDTDDDGYEEIPEDIAPYAVHDVIQPNERTFTNGAKGPERPVPPLKSGFTLKTRNSPPAVYPRVPRANPVSVNGTAVDQRQSAAASRISFPKPVKVPPRPTSSPHGARNRLFNGPMKESRSQMVTVEFVVSTSMRLHPSTTSEEVQQSAKEVISRNLSSHLWCEMDGKHIRLDDYRASNILDLVKDGKLKLYCTP